MEVFKTEECPRFHSVTSNCPRWQSTINRWWRVSRHPLWQRSLGYVFTEGVLSVSTQDFQPKHSAPRSVQLHCALRGEQLEEEFHAQPWTLPHLQKLMAAGGINNTIPEPLTQKHQRLDPQALVLRPPPSTNPPTLWWHVP